MDTKDLLILITILGFLLTHAKLDGEEDEDTRKSMNNTLMEIFAKLLAEAAGPEVIERLDAIVAANDEDAKPSQDDA